MFVPGRFYKQYLELILAEMTEKNQVSKKLYRAVGEAIETFAM